MSYQGQTAGLHAGVQTNDVDMSLALETQYAQYSGRAMQSLRFTSETFREQVQRARTPEIMGRGEVCAAFTTQSSVSGTISGAFSLGGHDALFHAVLGTTPHNGVATNSTDARSWTICSQFGGQWLVRYGCYCTRLQLTLSQGSFAQVAFDFTAASQVMLTQDIAPLRLDAPVGPVLNTVENFGGLWIDDLPIDGTVRGLAITLERDGAAADYGLGKPGACGQRPGELQASGSVQVFFRSYALFRRYRGGRSGRLSVSITDGAGSAYIFTFLNAVLLNPKINAGGRNTSVIADFDIEGNPVVGGGTFTLTRQHDPALGLCVAGAPLSLQGLALRP